MRRLIAFLTVVLLTVSAAWATSTLQGHGAPAGTGGGIADFWWIIVVAVLIAIAVLHTSPQNQRVKDERGHGQVGGRLDLRPCARRRTRSPIRVLSPVSLLASRFMRF